MPPFVLGLMFIATLVVSGIAYGRGLYGLALFAMFWAGYDFCLFLARAFPS